MKEKLVLKSTITTLEIQKIKIQDCLLIIKNDVYSDNRGGIWTTWHQKNFKKIKFVHDKFVISKKVLRGMHYDLKTYNKHFSINISNGDYSLLLPPMNRKYFF